MYYSYLTNISYFYIIYFKKNAIFFILNCFNYQIICCVNSNLWKQIQYHDKKKSIKLNTFRYFCANQCYVILSIQSLDLSARSRRFLPEKLWKSCVHSQIRLYLFFLILSSSTSIDLVKKFTRCINFNDDENF